MSEATYERETIMNKVTSAISFLFASFFALPAFAQAAEAAGSNDFYGFVALGAGLAIGVAAAGGGMGQGRAAAAALCAPSRCAT